MTTHDGHDLAVELFGECPTCLTSDNTAFPTSNEGAKPELPSPAPDFDGATYRRPDDYERLGAQARRVWDALEGGAWWTLAGLAEVTGDPEASISARLRDFRKGQWGSHRVVAERLGVRGLWRYRLAVTPPA